MKNSPTQGPTVHSAEPQLTAPVGGTDLEVVLSAQTLQTDVRREVSGSLRVRRRVVSETRTVEVTVSREELVIDGVDVELHDGVYVGTGVADAETIGHPDASGAPDDTTEPLVVVLSEERIEVVTTVHPYERVSLRRVVVAGEAVVHEVMQREDVEFSG